MFRTINRILYQVQFKPSGYIFESDPDIQPFVYEISILVIDNPAGLRPPSDPLVANTIALIFGQFFQQHERIAVYICDTSDQRGLARHRKFTVWFERYKGSNYMQLSDSVVDEQGVAHFISLIIQHKNPRRTRILLAFDSLIAGNTK